MRFRGRMRQELQHALVGGQIDILMLQEHHLSESRIRRCGRLLQGQSETCWSAGFGTAGAQGGVCIAIAESLCNAIEDRGIIVPGRAQWIIMRVGEDRIGFLNVYAPNVAGGRAEFWTTIGNSLPAVDHWCGRGL